MSLIEKLLIQTRFKPLNHLSIESDFRETFKSNVKRNITNFKTIIKEKKKLVNLIPEYADFCGFEEGDTDHYVQMLTSEFDEIFAQNIVQAHSLVKFYANAALRQELYSKESFTPIALDRLCFLRDYIIFEAQGLYAECYGGEIVWNSEKGEIGANLQDKENITGYVFTARYITQLNKILWNIHTESPETYASIQDLNLQHIYFQSLDIFGMDNYVTFHNIDESAKDDKNDETV